MNTLVFDIETIPDTDLGRRLYDLHGLADEQVAHIMGAKRHEATGSEFLPHEQHRIVAISVVMRNRDILKVWSVGETGSSEKELIERFFDGVEKYTPDLVSWNGSGFDLPVLHYRSLLHGVTAARYWETGDSDAAFRFNNYRSRYHWRHLDLMDVLANFQSRGRVKLENIALLLGLPGKIGMHGSMVWDEYRRGGLSRIRAYCETDVLNTYLVYLRFELMRGRLDAERHEHETARLRQLLQQSDAEHLRQFAEAWPAA